LFLVLLLLLPLTPAFFLNRRRGWWPRRSWFIGADTTPRREIKPFARASFLPLLLLDPLILSSPRAMRF
jgi:hypothetical protein